MKDLISRAYRAWQSPDSFKDPKKAIADPATPALALMVAARKLLGPGWLAWEPETLWLELDLLEMNRDKLGAAIALATLPSFWWDWRVFGQTCLALNDMAVFPEQLPKPSLEQMSWGVFEAELILALSEDGPIKPVFDDGVLAYIAVCAHDQGVVRLCENLQDAQPHLDKLLSPAGKELASQVKKLWQPHADVEDNAVGVQLAHLSRAQLYQVKRAETLATYF